MKESIDFFRFKCEKQYFADYLRNMAPQDDKNNVAKVSVFVTHERGNRLCHIDNESIIKISTSSAWKAYDSSIPVPAILISEMARHIEYAGQGLGRLMIDWVISKALNLSRYAACRLVIVESVEDKVETYRHWGFEPIENFEEKRNTMFLRIS